MEIEVKERQLKIFCPTHQTVFDVEEKPNIVCEILEHTLSVNFPNAEFWQYCCDCQTFAPSKFGTGGKAQDKCFNCERETVYRFVCRDCKIIAFDSADETKGKIFSISLQKGIKPNCPGCQKTFSEPKLFQHNCTDVDSVILTGRTECPFCLKSTSQTGSQLIENPQIPQVSSVPLANMSGRLFCPKCGIANEADMVFCGECGFQFGKIAETVKAGSADPKTLLLGSICPNCGTGNPKDTLFCNNCGQMFKTQTPLPPNNPFNTAPLNATAVLPVSDFNKSLPPPPPIPNQSSTSSLNNSTIFNSTLPGSNTIPIQANSSKKKQPIVVISLLVAFFLFLVIFLINSSKNPRSSSSSSYSTNSANSTNSPHPYASLLNKNGKIVGNDLKIRSYASPNAPQVGVLYLNTRIKILDARSSDTGTLWYRVKVVEYGCSKTNSYLCGKDNANDQDEGWAYSGYIGLDN